MTNTLKMHAAEIKELLKKEPSVDLNNPNYKFTLWAENGPQGFLFEDHAAQEGEIINKWATRMYTSKTRMAVLNIHENELYLFSCEVSWKNGTKNY